MITVLTWLWQQENPRFVYNAAHVNVWAKAVKANTTLDIQLACVTDHPKGIDKDIKIIKPPKDFTDIRVKAWNPAYGMPQCFRRISMFRPDAADIFGERFICMDLDLVIFGNIDNIIGFTEDIRMMRGSNRAKRPYNGGIIAMTAGVRPQVYKKFSQKNAELACTTFVGSDQAWISHCLEWDEAVFGPEDGVIFLSRNGFKKLHKVSDFSIALFPGEPKFFMDGTFHKATKSEVDTLNRLYGRELWNRGLAAEDPVSFVIRMPKKDKTSKKSRGRRYRLNSLK